MNTTWKWKEKIPQFNKAGLTWKIVQTLVRNLHETKIVTVFLKKE